MRSNASARLGRLTGRPDFVRMTRRARKAAMPGLVLQAAPTPAGTEDGAAAPRVGFTASKKVGNAVARNRARRRLKAAARDVLAERAGERMDYVLIARAGTAGRPYDDLLADLRACIERTARVREAAR